MEEMKEMKEMKEPRFKELKRKSNLSGKLHRYLLIDELPTNFRSYDVKEVYVRGLFFEESENFDETFAKLVAQKKHIYMAVDPNFFATKREKKSKLSRVISQQALLDDYYYFFHDIENLNGFYTKFEDFLLYMLSFANLQKHGFTFLAQPHQTFENPHLKLLFSFLYVGKCSNANYFNTAILKTLKKNHFYYQHRTAYPTLLFNDIKSSMVKIDEYVPEV